MPTGVYERTKPVWNKGKKLSKSHRESLSKSWNYEKHITDKVRKSAREVAKKYLHTKAVAKKISKSLTGRKLSKQHRENLRISHLGQKQPWTGKPQSEAHKLKNRLASLGRNTKEKHWNWKGGITELYHAIRNSDRYKQWRKAVFEKDNYICQKCNIKGRTLEAHHIKSLTKLIKENNIKTLEQAIKCKELWDVKNGITYCIECHMIIDKYRRRRKTR